MKHKTYIILPLVLLYGLMAGFFYAYSVSVMLGLNDSAPATAIEAMQGINLRVKNAPFFFTYFFTPFLSALITYLMFKAGEKQISLLLFLATIIYVFGVIFPTFFINVPMNEALAQIDIRLSQAQLSLIWKDYSQTWALWNSVRAFFSTVALGLTAVSLTKA